MRPAQRNCHGDLVIADAATEMGEVPLFAKRFDRGGINPRAKKLRHRWLPLTPMVRANCGLTTIPQSLDT